MSKVLVIGDVILDHYIMGNVNRLSPEAPIPVLEYTNEFYRLGGAANVANNINGVPTTLKGVGGLYNFGIYNKLLEKVKFTSKIDLTNELFLEKTRYASNSHHYLLRVDKGLTYQNTFIDINGIKEEANDYDIIVMSDYCKGTITHEVAQALNRIRRDKRVIVDSKNSKSRTVYYQAYLVTPNTQELKALLNSDVISYELIQAFMRVHEVENLLHTMSGDGMTLYTFGKTPIHFPVLTQSVYDVTGAGDTVVATIAEFLAKGETLTDAIKAANKRASIVVQHFGTSTTEG